jgi:ribosomal-protein-serine acetyltransferase
MFLLVDEEITLRELALKDAVSIFNTIDSEREYLGEWLPFVELTQDVSFTSRFIENYLKTEERDLTCIIRYHNRFVGLIGLKDTDYDNNKTEIAKSWKDNVLSRGGTEAPMVLYKRFRGQEPTIDALLIRDGIKKETKKKK